MWKQKQRITLRVCNLSYINSYSPALQISALEQSRGLFLCSVMDPSN
uniref:Uncharacterized protein n=1 Tax=Anguilla anguilla TaxID=7936 RepID=A0A0E9P8Z5_ANGAN